MTLPPTVTVTFNRLNAALSAQNGQVEFTPSIGTTDAGGNPTIVPITDASNQVVIDPTPVPVPLNRGQGSIDIVPTDTAGLNPPGWFYQVTVDIPGIPNYSNFYNVPSSPDPVDLSELTPLVSPTPADLVAYLLLTGGILSGPVTLAGSPPLKVPGASAGEVLTSDGSGNFTPQATAGDKTYTHPFTTASTVTVTHNLGKYPAVTVMDSSDDWVVGDVVYTDLDNLTVSFSAPFSGTVICN